MRRCRTLCILLFSGLLAVVVASVAGEPAEPATLRSFSAEYALSRGYLELARVEVTLEVASDGSYRYRALTLPVGLTAVLRKDVIREESSGLLRANEVVPRSYLYRHQGGDKPRLVELEFDWASKRVTNSTGGSSWSMGVAPGTQDKFSQRLALMLAVAAGRHTIDLPVADGGRTKAYRFRLLGEETVDVDAGRFQALKLERRKNQRPSRVSLWLAPELGYLPVMVKKREKDGIYWMQLRSVAWQ